MYVHDHDENVSEKHGKGRLAGHRDAVASIVDGPALGIPGSSPTTLTSHQVAHLQGAAGNRAVVGAMVQRGRAGKTKGEAKRRKGEPLPGRRKRRQQAEDDDMFAMDLANRLWEDPPAPIPGKRALEPEPDVAAKPPVAHPGPRPRSQVAEDPVPQPTPPVIMAKPPLTIAELKESKAPKDLLIAHYPHHLELALQMFRSFRAQNFSSTSALEKHASDKLGIRAQDEARESGPGLGARSSPLNQPTRQGSGPQAGSKRSAVKKGSGYLAGDGGKWHVHFDHVKYGSNGATRINFSGRSQDQILTELTTKSGLVSDRTHFAACEQWIRNNCA
ncbi:hypothetical protein IF650_03395 [Cellulosimicrobium terreum]|nr:hypothetical protein [Cellulosimicrobium terreum]